MGYKKTEQFDRERDTTRYATLYKWVDTTTNVSCQTLVLYYHELRD